MWQAIATTPMHPEYPPRIASRAEASTFAEEIASARVWAGLHYRFSTRAGTDMGYQIGEYVVTSVMRPVATGSR